MNNRALHPVKSSPVRDTYKFGDGPEPVLQPGTMGWTAADLENPLVAEQWEQGRYEILDGVLTVMPAVFFRGSKVSLRLLTLIRAYLDQRQVPFESGGEVDMQVTPARRVRADLACVIGDDLPKFAALKFEDEETDWQDHALIIPPTLVVESVSKGHADHDRQTKRRWYAEFGVRHYWIVDAYQKSLECLVLERGQYVNDGNGSGTDVVSPGSLPGLSLPLAEVWGQ